MRHWYAVHTKPRQEHLAADHLQRQQFETYLPLCKERKLHKGSHRWLTTPLFPRYLFVNLDKDTQSSAPIRSTTGCCGLVRFGLRTPALPDRFIEQLRTREGTQGAVELAQPAYTPGQRLIVTDGPFSGVQAIYQTRTADERVLILLQWLGAERPVQVPEHTLAPLAA